MGDVGELRAPERDRGGQPWGPPREGRRQRRRSALPVVALVVGLIVGGAGGVLLGRPGAPLGPRPQEETPEETIARLDQGLPPVVDAPEAGGAWSALAPAPLPPRTSQAVVAGADELLVWGGAAEDASGATTFLADGAALDPVAGTWLALPAAPLEGRTGAATALAGDQLVVWGGQGRGGFLADGAALDLATGRWRALAAAPLSARSGAVAVWTGEELLVAGGRDNGGVLADAAALDPASGRWRQVAALPEPLARAVDGLRAVVPPTGAQPAGRAVVWDAGRGGGGATVALWDGAADAWTVLPEPVVAGSGLPVLVSAPDAPDTLLGLSTTADGAETALVSLPVGAQTWTTAPGQAPLDDAWNAAAAALPGGGLVAVTPAGSGALWRDGAWSRLPAGAALPGGPVATTWTGQSVLVTAAAPPGRPVEPPAAARYQP